MTSFVAEWTPVSNNVNTAVRIIAWTINHPSGWSLSRYSHLLDYVSARYGGINETGCLKQKYDSNRCLSVMYTVLVILNCCWGALHPSKAGWWNPTCTQKRKDFFFKFFFFRNTRLYQAKIGNFQNSTVSENVSHFCHGSRISQLGIPTSSSFTRLQNDCFLTILTSRSLDILGKITT